MSKCFKCEGQHVTASMVEVKKGMRFCKPCHDATYFRCGLCPPERGFKLRDGNLAQHINGMDVCEYCFYTQFRKCRSCRVSHLITAGIVSGENNFFCSVCAVDRFFDCAWCNRHHEIDYLWQRVPEDGAICRNCQSAYTAERNPPPIHEYSYKPKPKMQGKHKAGLFFGVELEVDAVSKRASSREDVPTRIVSKNEETAKQLRKEIPFIYCKRDGSVPGGFEIVTHPMSYYWILQNKAAFDPIWGLVKKGYVSHDSGLCGMHIHMSKCAFSPLHLYKFIQFFQKNKEFILVVSQRDKADLERWANVAYEGVSDKRLPRMAMDKGGHPSRRQAVNLTPSNTVEIRIFRGTLKKERFFKNLEFCQALYEFTMIVSAANCTLEKFLGFVALYKKEYANLYAFLNERYSFTLLHRKKGKGAKLGLRYSGVKKVSSPDLNDADWEDHIAEVKDAEAKEIQKKIAMAHGHRATAAR